MDLNIVNLIDSFEIGKYLDILVITKIKETYKLKISWISKHNIHVITFFKYFYIKLL